MKLFLVFVGLVVAVSAFEPINNDYHNTVGVFEYARIKQAEESADFDGSRITGGSPSSLGQFPHLGGLIVALVDGRNSACGSSLISNTRLVTAAHCWTSSGAQGRQVTVVLGSVRIFSGGTRIITTDVRLHENYDRYTLANDIAVIIIDYVNYNNNIRNINLASGSDLFVGVIATAAGFGRTSEGAGVSAEMHHVNLQVISNDVCWRTYGNSVISSTLCVATPSGRSTCNGDSGGPLATNGVLIGVSSFGHKDGCTVGHPAAFSRVTSYSSWILSV